MMLFEWHKIQNPAAVFNHNKINFNKAHIYNDLRKFLKAIK